ncbi:MAG: dTMP kinase [Anaerolineaceae bacterium]|nr:dTMP kinase [Anaerolineaceae bacterium]
MINHDYPGKLIVIEGLDGAGTTTQSALLCEWLQSHQAIPEVLLTQEPSRGPIGAMIRAALGKRITFDYLTLAGMYATDRLDHLYCENGVIDRLKQGAWVLMDRYYLSSFAYQASQMSENELAWLKIIHEPCLIPDLTIFLDVPVEVCLKRIEINRQTAFELFEKKSFLENVLDQYNIAMTYFEHFGENILRVDGLQSIEEIQSEMKNIITHNLLV